MSTGKSPYRTAAAAIYNVCVSKKYPTFAETMSPDAQHFLGRYEQHIKALVLLTIVSAKASIHISII